MITFAVLALNSTSCSWNNAPPTWFFCSIPLDLRNYETILNVCVILKAVFRHGTRWSLVSILNFYGPRTCHLERVRDYSGYVTQLAKLYKFQLFYIVTTRKRPRISVRWNTWAQTNKISICFLFWWLKSLSFTAVCVPLSKYTCLRCLNTSCNLISTVSLIKTIFLVLSSQWTSVQFRCIPDYLCFVLHRVFYSQWAHHHYHIQILFRQVLYPACNFDENKNVLNPYNKTVTWWYVTGKQWTNGTDWLGILGFCFSLLFIFPSNFFILCFHILICTIVSTS